MIEFKVDCKYIKKQRMYLNAKGRIWSLLLDFIWDKFNDFRHMDPIMYPIIKEDPMMIITQDLKKFLKISLGLK